MALQYVNKSVADGSSTTLSVTGIDSNNPYVVFGYNITPATTTASMYARVTTSGTQDSDSTYDYKAHLMNSGGAFGDVTATNAASIEILSNMNTAYGKSDCVKFELFNFNLSTANSFLIYDNIRVEAIQGWMGGAIHKVNETNDGIGIFPNAGNVGSGSTLVLYKVV